MAVNIRPATPSDADACGHIIFEAFESVARAHGFAPDFPSPEAGIQLAQTFITDPNVFAVVAEENGRVIGSNFLSEKDPIRGVGPITAGPQAQGRGIGRRLMEAVIERGKSAVGIRLLQDGYNMRSLSLYASLGFEVREPVVLMAGRPTGKPIPGAVVRPLSERNLRACGELYARIHGFSRSGELAAALTSFAPMVVERDGRITGYLAAPTFWIANHSVAETEDDMRALILGAGAAAAEPLSFLLPSRQARLLRWCLDNGLRAVKPMTIMSMGEYRTPHGDFTPSVFY